MGLEREVEEQKLKVRQLTAELNRSEQENERLRTAPLMPDAPQLLPIPPGVQHVLAEASADATGLSNM